MSSSIANSDQSLVESFEKTLWETKKKKKDANTSAASSYPFFGHIKFLQLVKSLVTQLAHHDVFN